MDSSLRPADSKTDSPVTPTEDRGIAGWLCDNVAKPFVSGTGVLQVASNFTEHRLSWQAPAANTKTEWVVQTAASALGGLAVYVPIGRLAGGGLTRLARGVDQALIAEGAAEGLSVGTAKFLSHSATGQILGAGAYDFIKNPNDGETRVGNAAGSMAGFMMFEGGNRALGLASTTASLTGARQYLAGRLGETAGHVLGASAAGAGRFTVGALGGATSFETSHAVTAAVTGRANDADWDGLKESMLSGGFINWGLPLAQRGATRLIDKHINSAEWGAGVPVERQLGYSGFRDAELTALSEQLPLTRVKSASDGVTRADISNNTVYLAEGDGAGRLGHELRHIQLARELESHYLRVAELLERNPAAAQEMFFQLRSYAESEARRTEHRINARAGSSDQGGFSPPDDHLALGNQRAANGQTYQQIWNNEWQAFKDNPRYRPPVEFEEDSQKTSKPANEFEAKVWGRPDLLGPTVAPEGINFAVQTGAEATRVELLLFDHVDATTPSSVLPMFKTGDTWHRFVPELKPGALYLYRADGPWDPQKGLWYNANHALIDPFAKAVTGDTNRPVTYEKPDPLKRSSKDNIADMPKAVVIEDSFDWQGVKPPEIAPENLLVGEVQVRAFTAQAADVPENERGTYAGLTRKIDYLKRLGVNAVKIMPTDAFDTMENGKVNDWGYQPWNYFAPKPGLAADKTPGGAVTEYKTMVRELHRNGIMVISDEVFNHTSEGDHIGPTISFRGLDNIGYYTLEPNDPMRYVDHTGVGNTLNPASPRVQRLVLEALKYKFLTMHMDGIRYDLGAFMSRDPNHTLLSAIQNDPLLSSKLHIHDPKYSARATDTPASTKVQTIPSLANLEAAKPAQPIIHILEAWDIHQNLEGRLPAQAPGPDGVGMYNESGAARDTIRAAANGDATLYNQHGITWALDRLIKGRPVVNGAADAYSDPRTVKPLVFTFSHDGQTATDNEMYHGKYNDRPGQDNGENNRDGENHNASKNHGVEGPTDDPAINAARRRAEDNKWILNLLPVSTIKMIRIGDESRQTKQGNNNTYPQPHLNDFNWQKAAENADVVDRRARIANYLIHEQRLNGLTSDHVDTYGVNGDWHNFDWGSRAIAWQYRGTADGSKRLFIISNNFWGQLDFKLPAGKWRLIEDTARSDEEILRGGRPDIGDTYQAAANSLVIFETDEPAK